MPLFRFAIFISGALPFTWSGSVGQDVFNLLTGENPLSTNAYEWQYHSGSGPADPQSVQSSESDILTEMFPTWKARRQTLLDLAQKPDNAHLRPRCFHPDLHREKISIPTAHVYGKQDQFRLHAKHLVRLCDATVTAVFEHEGVHDVPHSIADNKIVSELVQKTILRSEFAI